MTTPMTLSWEEDTYTPPRHTWSYLDSHIITLTPATTWSHNVCFNIHCDSTTYDGLVMIGITSFRICTGELTLVSTMVTQPWSGWKDANGDIVEVTFESMLRGALCGHYVPVVSLLCFVLLCYVMLCYIMLCYVMLCYVMLCYVMLCYVMLCLLCYVMCMLCYVLCMLCYVMLCVCYVMFVMLCYVMLCVCYVMFVMLCYVMLWILCHVDVHAMYV